MAPLELHEAFDTEAETSSLLESQFRDILEKFPYTSEQVQSIKSNIVLLIKIFDGVNEKEQEKIFKRWTQ